MLGISWPDEATQITRILMVYVFTLLMLRFAGKKRLARLSAFDFMIIIALGSAVGDIMIYPEHVASIWNSLLAIFMVVLLQVLVSKGMEHSKLINYIVRGRGTTLVKNGKVLKDNLAHEDMTMDELDELLKEKGFGRLSDVHEAILEPSGDLAVIHIRERR